MFIVIAKSTNNEFVCLKKKEGTLSKQKGWKGNFLYKEFLSTTHAASKTHKMTKLFLEKFELKEDLPCAVKFKLSISSFEGKIPNQYNMFVLYVAFIVVGQLLFVHR